MSSEQWPFAKQIIYEAKNLKKKLGQIRTLAVSILSCTALSKAMSHTVPQFLLC